MSEIARTHTGQRCQSYLFGFRTNMEDYLCDVFTYCLGAQRTCLTAWRWSSCLDDPLTLQ